MTRASRASFILGMAALALMLLTNARDWPQGGDWVLEHKWDGYRFAAGGAA